MLYSTVHYAEHGRITNTVNSILYITSGRGLLQGSTLEVQKHYIQTDKQTEQVNTEPLLSLVYCWGELDQ